MSNLLRERRFSVTMSGMNTRGDISGERGVSVLLVPLVLAIVFLVGAVTFGAWAYAQMQDYKNNVAAKVNVAVQQAKQQEDAVQAAQYAEKEKSPYRTYKGPAAYGSVTVTYPKTWSAYVIDTRNSSPYIDGYFYPNTVPDATSQNSVFALRVQVVQDTYSSVLNSISSFVQLKQSTVSPYSLPKVPNVLGARVDGQLPNQKSGSMVVLPLRNMTLEVWTESPDFQKDFTNVILPNFTFAP